MDEVHSSLFQPNIAEGIDEKKRFVFSRNMLMFVTIDDDDPLKKLYVIDIDQMKIVKSLSFRARKEKNIFSGKYHPIHPIVSQIKDFSMNNLNNEVSSIIAFTG